MFSAAKTEITSIKAIIHIIFRGRGEGEWREGGNYAHTFDKRPNLGKVSGTY